MEIHRNSWFLPIWNHALCYSRMQKSPRTFFQGWSRRVRRNRNHLPGSWVDLITINMPKGCNLKKYLGIFRGCRRRTCDSPALSLCCKYWKESRSLPLPTPWDVRLWRCHWTCSTSANGCKFSSAFVECWEEMKMLWLHFWHSSQCHNFWLSFSDQYTGKGGYLEKRFS